MDLNKIMKQAQAMQKKMEDMQAKLAEAEITGSSGGNMIQVTLSGKGDAKKVKIDKSLVKPDETEILEDLIVAAINDARNKTEKQVAEAMSSAASEIGIPPGFKLPF